MRIPTRLTLAMSTAALGLFALHGVWQLSVQWRELRAQALQHAEVVARSVQVSAENALRDKQIDDVRETMDRLDRLAPDTDIIAFDPKVRRVAASPGAAPHDAKVDAAGAQAISALKQIVQWDEDRKPPRLIIGLPLQDDDGTLLGGMAMVQPLTDLQADFRGAASRTVFIAVIMALGMSGLGAWLSGWYVARPLEKTVGAMAGVRAGDLDTMLPVIGDDEVTEVAREFNAMVAELRAARRQLQEEAESRRRMQRTLQEADKLITLGQLAAGLAHEIGSPLQILGGRARSLLARPHDPEDVQRQAGILVEQTDRITKIVQELMRFARRRPARFEPIDVAEPIAAVLSLLEVEARRRQVALTLERPPELPAVRADADRLQQITLNLVTNALAATPPGGAVRVSVEPWSGGVRVVVGDTGAGMSEDVLEHLFEPFFTTRVDEGGTGLGLAVVKALVLEHGGTIRATSVPGEGSELILDLPGAREA